MADKPFAVEVSMPAEPTSIVLDDKEAARFLDALDHPERFEAGLRRLVERPSVLPS